MTAPGSAGEGTRLDRWLWAARFFRSRSLAKAAVEGGKVAIVGITTHPKPSREVQIGTRLEIRRGDERFVVRIVALADKRGPASIARTLYEEDPESIEQREAERARRAMARLGLRVPSTRPEKHDRRALRDLKGQGDDT